MKLADLGRNEVYVIHRKRTGQRYVGCGDAHARIRDHATGHESNADLAAAIAEDIAEFGGGFDDHYTFSIVPCVDRKSALANEMWLIALCGGPDSPILFNNAWGSADGKTHRMTDKTKKKLSASKKGVPKTPEHRAAIGRSVKASEVHKRGCAEWQRKRQQQGE